MQLDINKYVCTQSHSTSDGELKRLIDMAAEYMTGMISFSCHILQQEICTAK